MTGKASIFVLMKDEDNGRCGTDTSAVGCHLVEEFVQAHADKLNAELNLDDHSRASYHVMEVPVLGPLGKAG